MNLKKKKEFEIILFGYIIKFIIYYFSWLYYIGKVWLNNFLIWEKFNFEFIFVMLEKFFVLSGYLFIV